MQRLSRVFHPDKSPSKIEDAQKTFVAIKQAHDVLVDPILRLAYEYGGLRAVALIKRSQASSFKQNNNESDSSDLYTELQRAKTKEEATSLLQQILHEDKLNRQQHQSENATSELSTNITFPHEYSFQTIEPTSTSVQFQSRLRRGDTWSFTIGGNASMQQTAVADTSTTISADYQPQRGTHVTLDSSFRPGQPLPNLSLRSSRQMANGTFLVAGLGGNLQSIQSWTYSVVSYRNLLWGSAGLDEAKTPKKLLASWRMSLNPAAGKFQQAIATIKTREFPQWRCSAGLSAFPLKISYQSAEMDSPYIAYSWGYTFSKIKLAWIQRLGGEFGDWTLKYGVKFDGRALYEPGALSLWTIIFQLYSSSWTIRIPISLFKNEAWSVASILTLLASQWCDQFLEDIWTNPDKEKSSVDGHYWNKGETESKTQASPFERFSGMIELVAAKKKVTEENTLEGGLVILSGWWEPATGVSFGSTAAFDVTAFLQYWVVDGTLLMPMSEVTQWLPRVRSNVQQATNIWGWKKVWRALQRIYNLSDENTEDNENSCFAILRIRYKYRQKVYDIEFSEAKDRKVYLPNDERASELGLADQVH